jgi:hypothetical protein
MVNQETLYPSPVIDIGLGHMDLASQSNQTGANDMDIVMSDYGDSQHRQSTPEEASGFATHTPSTQAPVFFDSDTDDSDDSDDNNQDQESRLEKETPPGPGNNLDTETERASQPSELVSSS